MPGFCFSNTDWVSGIIWLVISGFDTTATVIVPELLLLLALPLEPLLEQAASATRAVTEPSAPSVRSLNREELMNGPPQTMRLPGRGRDGSGCVAGVGPAERRPAGSGSSWEPPALL